MKNILVVGASSGIGSASAVQLSKDHNVFGTHFKNSENVRDAYPSFYLNVLEENIDLEFLPDTLDGLVYCPGAISLKPFSRITPDDFLADYQLQVLGAVKVIQAALPRLKRSSNASIVLMSTVAVQSGFNFHSLVAASKGAIEGLVRSLSAEFAPKIRINGIAPSITDTPLANGLLNTVDKIAANVQRHPLKRIGTVADMANAVTFLLSDASSWMTGQILKVDGGISVIK